MEKLKNNKWVIVSFIVIYISIFLICNCNLFAQDEYNYSNISWTNQRLSSFSDIFYSQKLIYQNWSGRIPVLTLVQVFLYIGTIFYDIFNPAVFILFIIMILKIADVKINIKNVFVVLFLSLFGAYKFWEKYIWISGSLNYLWTVTAMLVMMYYLKSIVTNNKKINILETFIFFIISFFAGWSHENTAFVLGSFIIFFLIFNFKKILNIKKSQKAKIVISIILFGIGAILLIFCPGNFGRLGDKRQASIMPVLKNILALYKVIAIYIGTIIVLLKSKIINSKIDTKQFLTKQFKTYILPLIVAVLPMIIIAEFPVRAALAYEVMLFIVIVKNMNLIYDTYYESKKSVRIINMIIVLVSIVILIIRTMFAIFFLEPYKEKIKGQIMSAKINGKENVVISKFEYENLAKLVGVYMDVFPKNIDIAIINSYMCNYYNLNTITAIKDGNVQIEIILKNEENIKDYKLIDKLTNEIVSERIINCDLVMPNMDVKNRVIFELPKDKINNVYVKDILPQDILEIKINSLESNYLPNEESKNKVGELKVLVQDESKGTIDSYEYIKFGDISEKQIENINNIIKRSHKLLEMVDYIKKPSYIIKFNDENYEDIGIRISGNMITLNTKEGNYYVYEENDCKYILDLIQEDYKYSSVKVLDVDKLSRPPKLYVVGVDEKSKFETGTYSWNIKNNKFGLGTMVMADSASSSEILKDKEAYKIMNSWTFICLKRNNDFSINEKLPESTVVKFRIYNENEDISNVEFKTAIRMVDGSYYIPDIPYVKGEYILELNVEFNSTNKAMYCKKISV